MTQQEMLEALERELRAAGTVSRGRLYLLTIEWPDAADAIVELVERLEVKATGPMVP
jgi:ribosomal protein S12 methylthiotransferase accessory factor YcaO